MKKVKITIEGMHCASCQMNAEKALLKVRGVKNAKVNLLFRNASVEADDNVNEADLKKAIKDAGYNATKVAFS